MENKGKSNYIKSLMGWSVDINVHGTVNVVVVVVVVSIQKYLLTRKQAHQNFVTFGLTPYATPTYCFFNLQN